jgi:hypothetical protein
MANSGFEKCRVNSCENEAVVKGFCNPCYVKVLKLFEQRKNISGGDWQGVRNRAVASTVSSSIDRDPIDQSLVNELHPHTVSNLPHLPAPNPLPVHATPTASKVVQAAHHAPTTKPSLPSLNQQQGNPVEKVEATASKEFIDSKLQVKKSLLPQSNQASAKVGQLINKIQKAEKSKKIEKVRLCLQYIVLSSLEIENWQATRRWSLWQSLFCDFQWNANGGENIAFVGR